MTTKEVTRRQIWAVIADVIERSSIADDVSQRVMDELAEDILTALEDAEMIRRGR